MLINKFIGGRTIHHAKNLKLKMPFGKIYDYVKEGNHKDHKINHKINLYALNQTYNSYHAIKLTSLYNSNLEGYLDDYYSLCIKNGNKILIDAENVKNQNMINDYSNYCIDNYDGHIFYKTYQMYRKDTLSLLENDLHNYKNNFGIKLVRGAYHNEDKSSGLLHLKKEDTHNDYDQAINLLSTYDNDVIIASHNNQSCKKALTYGKNFKYAQLLGMKDNLSTYLLNTGNKVYKYIPYGTWNESIPYLTRRLYENYDILKYIF